MALRVQHRNYARHAGARARAHAQTMDLLGTNQKGIHKFIYVLQIDFRYSKTIINTHRSDH